MLRAEFGWNCSSGSGEEDFKISLFHDYFPLQKGVAFLLNITQGC